jgi:serine/threonine protein kinase
LSIFRKSESYRNFKDTKKIINNNFFAPHPIIAVEKTGLLNSVKDSYFIMEYIDGYIPRKSDIGFVVEILNKIHTKGFLHGDSQTTNFIISNDSKKVYILDAKFNKNIYGNFGKIYEFIYLEKNYTDFYKEPLNLYDKNNFYYKICKSIDNYFENYSKFKKKLKNLIRNQK